MDNDYAQDETQELIPLEQHIILFYGKPIIVVRLPDGQPGVVLRSLCDNLQLEPTAQVRRIRRTQAIVNDLVYTRIQTEGGLQIAPTLILHAVPFWLAGIDTKRVRDEIRPDIIRYQREVVDVLYAWAQSPKTTPTDLAPTEHLKQPIMPVQNASALAWVEYHQQMATFYQWKATTDMRIDALEDRQSEIENRLDDHRRVLAFIPEILERLGPETLTPQHYRQVQTLAKSLHQTTNKPYPTIYDDLKTAFEKARIEDLLEDDWPEIENWFKIQIERGKRR